MPLLNYTTEVPASRSIGQVSGILVDAGARHIATEYNDTGHAIGIAFAIETGFGPRQYHLPIHPDNVQAVLVKQRVQARYATAEHAERVAWRILKDWVEAQLAIVKTEMVTLDQVMLPYMADDDGRTVYELYRDRQLALPAGP